MSLYTITAQLRSYAMQHPLDVLQGDRPHREHYRELTIDGHKYRICFTYQVSEEIKLLLLSVYDVELPDTLPDEAAARSIADAIFGGSAYQDGDELNINILNVSRKYLQFL
jgi:hypothetical protein